MPEDRRRLTRADLPEELTPDTIRPLPLSLLRRLSRPGNGVLDPAEQAVFDAALHEVMSETARRASGQINRADWDTVLRDAHSGARRGGPGRPSRVDRHVQRLARQIDQQVSVAEGLAPGVDWSFAQPVPTQPAPTDALPTAEPAEATETAEPAETAETATEPETADSGETLSDLEQSLTDQLELVQVMSEIADISRRTYALEQQRDLQSTRGVFFGFVVSVAVLVAGWAPVVAADDWSERFWILGLTVATCVLAGLVYAAVRRWQSSREPDSAD